MAAFKGKSCRSTELKIGLHLRALMQLRVEHRQRKNNYIGKSNKLNL